MEDSMRTGSAEQGAGLAPLDRSPANVLWLPDTEETRRDIAPQFDASVLDHPVLVLCEIDSLHASRTMAVQVLLITSFGGRLLDARFPGKKYTKTRAKYLPLERVPPAPHPDNGILLTTIASGNPALKSRQSYVALKPFVVNPAHLRPLYGGALKLTPAALQRVRVALVQRNPHMFQLPSGPADAGAKQPPMAMSESATPLVLSRSSSIASKASRASMSSSRSESPLNTRTPKTPVKNGPRSPPPLYSTTSPPLVPIPEGVRSPPQKPMPPMLPKLPHHPSSRRQSPAAVERERSMGVHRVYPTYPPPNSRTPLLFSNGQVIRRDDIFTPTRWPAAAQPEERDFCGKIFVVLQIVICCVILFSLCVLAIWLFFTAVQRFHL